MRDELTEVTAAYVAGIFDGEGCVQVQFANGGSRSLICALEISNSHFPVLYRIQRTWSGNVYETVKKQQGTDLKMGRLRFTGSSADALADAMLPYSIIKHEQLLIFQRARKVLKPRGRRMRRLTNDEVAQRQSLIDEVRAARKNGTVSWNA